MKIVYSNSYINIYDLDDILMQGLYNDNIRYDSHKNSIYMY